MEPEVIAVTTEEASESSTSAVEVAGVPSPAWSAKPEPYTYFTIAMGEKPISLVCEDQVASEPYGVEFVSCSKTCERQVSEMARVMKADFHITNKGKNKAYVYFLKYRHLQDHDLEALERIRKQSLLGNACFVFVDATQEEMAEPIKKLSKGILPYNVVLLPWESQMSLATRRAVVGLAVSLITEDHTTSQKAVTKARIPVRALESKA